MAGKIVASTLNNDTGVLATQNGMTGIAKAWVTFIGSSAAIQSSFNVSSITRNGTGNYVVNFSTALPNANYATLVSSGSTNVTGYTAICPYNGTNSTSQAIFSTFTTNFSANADASWISFAAFSS